MQEIKEGFIYEGLTGCLISELKWEKVGDSFEPSGHWHGVYNWVIKEQWFHPYNGALPTRTN